MPLATNIQSAFVRVGTEFKAIRILIGGSGTATTSELQTTATNLVGAVNELVAEIAGLPTGGGTTDPASETAAGIVELATVVEALAGVDTVRAITPAGVAAVRAALKEEILGAGVPAALDTLDELAAALGDDANFAATVTTALANIGDTNTDFVAIFEAALA
jgi:hypothetical protein